MLAAVKNGNVKELAELMRQDPGFDVNEQNENGWTLLHLVYCYHSRSTVIPILLAHPDIDVNVKNYSGGTPYYLACYWGCTSCVREMLKDSRVKVNEPDDDGATPLWRAAWNGRLDVIRWWIACLWEGDGSRETRG